MKKILISFVVLLCLIGFLFYIDYDSKNKKLIQDINKQIVKPREHINKYALPVIDDNSKYIELQTKNWIKQRENKGCYGLLEKDKIVMTKWMKHYNIKGPEILFYAYHDEFNKKDLFDIVKQKPNNRFIIKISHLQSNYGIIIVPPYNQEKEEKYLDKIYDKCLEKFSTCFVCNHDKSDPPTNKEIKEGKKKSYYELYETIKPGIIIQDFFYSEPGKVQTPEELKIMVMGNRIIAGPTTKYPLERVKLVYDEAIRISSILGSSLIRVDFFIDRTEKIFKPYLNEISLSPNKAMSRAKYVDPIKLEEYKKEVVSYKATDMEFIDNLIETTPKRDLPIKKYLTDADWDIFLGDKFRFSYIPFL